MTSLSPRALAWARLVRLPNVFTALADICLGLLVAGPQNVGLIASINLLLASAALYCGGIVWNDYFDIEQDRRERPERPLPSGDIPAAAAWRLGTALLAIGWVCAVLAGWSDEGWNVQPALTAAALAVAILLYDRWLKRTWTGPLAMGACRLLNVLLGLSAVSSEIVPWEMRWHLAGVVGVYIVGVTWFARAEAVTADPARLRLAAGVMAAGLALAVLWPLWWPEGTASIVFVYLLAAFALAVGWPVLRACARPTPSFVQRAVKQAILGLVALDALLATAAVGALGLLVLLLLPPAVALGRRVYST